MAKNAPGTNGVVVYAGYFYVSEGLSKRNLDMLQSIGQHIAGHGRPFICGADFSFGPEALASTDFATRLSAQIVHPYTSIGTCFQGAIATTIDYYLVSNSLSHGIASVGVDPEALTSPHRPAVLTFHPCLTSLKELTFQRPPPLPIRAPVGPMSPPQD